jgi:hypothetical protein
METLQNQVPKNYFDAGIQQKSLSASAVWLKIVLQKFGTMNTNQMIGNTHPQHKSKATKKKSTILPQQSLLAA